MKLSEFTVHSSFVFSLWTWKNHNTDKKFTKHEEKWRLTEEKTIEFNENSTSHVYGSWVITLKLKPNIWIYGCDLYMDSITSDSEDQELLSICE